MIEQGIKYVFLGDKTAGKTLIRAAQREMMITERCNAQGKLQYERKMSPFPGATITTEYNHGMRTATIFVPQSWEEQVGGEKICLCNCNFSVGAIIQDNGQMIGTAHLYDVMACVGKDRQKRFNNVLASDFCKYEEGQKIVLMAYNSFLYQCCLNDERYPSGCNPLPSEFQIAEEEWRTTYRILPWCALPLPRWLNITGGGSSRNYGHVGAGCPQEHATNG